MAYNPPPGGAGYPPPGGPGYPPPGGPGGPGYPPPGGAGYPAAGASGAYANWVQRFAAALIDWAPVVGAYIVLVIIDVAVNGGILGLLLSLIFWVGMVGWWVYNRFITMGNTGQSLGKRVMNIKLVSEATGQPIGAGQAFIRDIAHVLDGFCLIGYLFPLWDPKCQTFADKILTTIVVPA